MFIWLIIIATVCEFQFVSFIVLSIQLTIGRNSKVSEFVCFGWIQFLHNLTHSIFLLHSHSYFITHIHCFVDSSDHRCNSKVREVVVLTENNLFMIWLVPYFWCTHIHFITHIHYFDFWFYLIPTTISTLKSHYLLLKPTSF